MTGRTKSYYEVLRGPTAGKFAVITQAGVVIADVFGEIQAHQICDLMNWYQESLLRQPWGERYTQEDIMRAMNESLSAMPDRGRPAPARAPVAPSIPALPRVPSIPSLPVAPSIPARGPVAPVLPPPLPVLPR